MDRGAWRADSPRGHKESDMIEHIHRHTSFAPEVTPRSVDNVRLNLYQTHVIFSALKRKRQVSKHRFHPPGSRAWLRRARAQQAAP